MGILRNYINNGVPQVNRINFDSGERPLVIKDVPLTSDAKVPTYTTEASRRLTDLERISKLMIKPEGLKYLANNAMLDQLTFKPDSTKSAGGKVLERVGQGLLSTAKLLGSTLAQVPVNGTGIHFVQSFEGIKGTYLESKGAVKQGGVPPHVAVKPGLGNVFLKDKLGKIDVGKVAINTEDIKKQEIRREGTEEEKIIGPAKNLFPTSPSKILNVETGKEENIGQNYAGGPVIEPSLPDLDGNPAKKRNTSFDSSLTGSINVRVNIGDPGNQGSEDPLVRTDKLNLLGPLEEVGNNLPEDGEKEGRDLIKFRFEIVTPGEANGSPKVKHLYFRAYLDSFSDGFTSNWSGFNYVGRGETFYNYGGMDRSIQLGFKVSAQSAEEMRPLYQKINVLASSVAPTYNNSFMRGTLAKLTVGDYVYRQPGFIEKVDFQWDQEYPWEIAMNRPESLARDIPHQELPMVLDVSVSFKPIHNFLPTSEYTLASKTDALAGKGTLSGPRYISHGSTEENRYIK